MCVYVRLTPLMEPLHNSEEVLLRLRIIRLEAVLHVISHDRLPLRLAVLEVPLIGQGHNAEPDKNRTTQEQRESACVDAKGECASVLRARYSIDHSHPDRDTTRLSGSA